ncbi:MAG: hypothetical protein Q8R25_00230 [bacterium]|nr:hypothetical protein [bacterium]
MFALKIGVLMLFIGVGFLLYQTRKYARMRFKDWRAVWTHQLFGRITLGVTILAVVLTEVMVKIAGLQATPLFWVHLSLALPFLLILIALQWMTGYRAPFWHKVLGYTCIIAYVGTLITGTVLLYDL